MGINYQWVLLINYQMGLHVDRAPNYKSVFWVPWRCKAALRRVPGHTDLCTSCKAEG